MLKAQGAHTFTNRAIFEARHWGVIDRRNAEKGTYHRTLSGYAVSAFYEALRLTLEHTISLDAVRDHLAENYNAALAAEWGRLP